MIVPTNVGGLFYSRPYQANSHISRLASQPKQNSRSSSISLYPLHTPRLFSAPAGMKIPALPRYASLHTILCNQPEFYGCLTGRGNCVRIATTTEDSAKKDAEQEE